MANPTVFDLRRNPVAAYLQREGYRLEVVPWMDGAQCTLRYGTERWTGRGKDTVAAFEEALRAAAPSKIARALLREAAARVNEESSGAPAAGARAGRR